MNRVCHPEEASHILSSPDPDAGLWLYWAAKESAFKVVSKVLGSPPVFSHARFRVRVEKWPEGLGSTGFTASGRVTYQDLQVPFRASMTRERIHGLAYANRDPAHPPPDIEVQTGEAAVGRNAAQVEAGVQPFALLLQERFTARERASVHNPASAFVRLFARSAVADALGVEEKRLEIVCGRQATGRVPPTVLLDGAPTPVDLSMSHHGHLVGWAFAVELSRTPA